MKNHFLLLCLIIIALGSSCKKNIFGDDKLSLSKENFNGSELKLNGYYYQLSDDSISSIYCLYRNGVIRHLGDGVKLADLNQFEQTIRTSEFLEKTKKIKYSWGLFEIDGSIILFERWHPSSGGSLPAYIRSGSILNDSTFQIEESYRMVRGKKKEYSKRNERFQFKAFSPKPDSTSNFTN
jgi:hypothetical protein